MHEMSNFQMKYQEYVLVIFQFPVDTVLTSSYNEIMWYKTVDCWNHTCRKSISKCLLDVSTVKMGIFFPLADPLVGSIATQYLQNREEHDRIARLWTKRYATWCVGVNHLSQVGRSSVCQTVTADLRRYWCLFVEACSHHLFQSQKTCVVYEVCVCVWL